MLDHDLLVAYTNVKLAQAKEIKPRPIDLQIIWNSIIPILDHSFNNGYIYGREYEQLYLGNDVY